jgi:hypothetical protein
MLELINLVKKAEDVRLSTQDLDSVIPAIIRDMMRYKIPGFVYITGTKELSISSTRIKR